MVTYNYGHILEDIFVKNMMWLDTYCHFHSECHMSPKQAVCWPWPSVEASTSANVKDEQKLALVRNSSWRSVSKGLNNNNVDINHSPSPDLPCLVFLFTPIVFDAISST